MDKIKNQLAGVAALLGVIAAIGGGFVKYGEITTKLDALENAGGTGSVRSPENRKRDFPRSDCSAGDKCGWLRQNQHTSRNQSSIL